MTPDPPADRGLYSIVETLPGFQVGDVVDVDRDAWRPLIDGGVLREALEPLPAGEKARVVLEKPTPGHLRSLEDRPPEHKSR